MSTKKSHHLNTLQQKTTFVNKSYSMFNIEILLNYVIYDIAFNFNDKTKVQKYYNIIMRYIQVISYSLMHILYRTLELHI